MIDMITGRHELKQILGFLLDSLVRQSAKKEEEKSQEDEQRTLSLIR
jgi:hypothetical protein